MKKWLSIICLIGIFAGLLSACGKDKNANAVSGADKTLLSAAADLANELDNVPTIAELTSGDHIDSVFEGPLTASPADASGNQSEVISPLGVEFCGTDTYYPKEPPKQTQDGNFLPLSEEHYEGIDATIESLKLVKNHVLEACKTFSTWITYYIEQASANTSYLAGHGECRDYRLQYDVNRDVVVIEQRYKNVENRIFYVRIAVSYNPDGKLRMDGVTAVFNDTAIVSSDQLHYLEDQHYISVERSSENQFDTLSVFDLQTNEYANTYIGYHRQYDNVGNIIFEESTGLEETYCFSTEHLTFECSADGGEIKFLGGDYGGQWSYTSNCWFSLSLNLFDGWSSVTNTDDQQMTLVTDKGEFVFNTVGSSPVDPSGVCRYSVDYFDRGMGPTLYIYATGSDALWTLEEAQLNIGRLCDVLGISFKDGYENELYESMYSYEAHKNAFHYIDGIYGNDINEELFKQMIEQLQTEELSHASLREMWKEPAIAFEAQTAEYDYFEFLDYTLTGTAAVDETTHKISLTGITATLAPSVLLKDDTAYSLVFVWASADEHQEVGRIDLRYTGESLTFESDIAIASDRFPKNYGEYVLMAYLADDAGNRISTLQTIPASSEYSAELTGEEYSATLTVTKNNIAVNNTVVPKKNSEQDLSTSHS